MRIWTRTGLCAIGGSLLGMPALAQFTMSPTSYPIGTAPDAVAAGDFDNDGDLDLAAGTDAPDKISLLFNAGNGTYGAPVNVLLAAGSGPYTVVAGDLDGDGDVDLAVSLHNANTVRVILNNGGTFTPGASFAVGTDPRDLKIADLDNDLDNDLVVSNRSGNSVTVLRNNGGLSFSPTTYRTGVDPREIDLGDVTGDGLFDIAVAAHDSEAVLVLRNTGGAAFVNHATLSTSPRKPSGVTMSRLDANTTLDIAAAGSDNGIEYAIVFLNGGGGAFGAQVAYVSGGLNANSIVAADLDVDGDQDLALANQDSNNVSMLPNSGTGTFGAAQVVRVGADPSQILAGDFDGNAATDLVTANTTGGNVTVLSNGALGASPMHASCSPGENGVNGCPCGNPPTSMGRGCDNFGAGPAQSGQLTATGVASLLNDGDGTPSILLMASGENNTSTTVFWTGKSAPQAPGVPHGAGLRCVTQSLKRLYNHQATGGAVSAPAGPDISVSLRTAQLYGAPILPGESRYYFNIYRDPQAAGPCGNTSSTVNLTNAGRIIWNP